MVRRFCLGVCLVFCPLAGVADELKVETVEVTLAPASPPTSGITNRLLPLPTELEPGNAAPVMIRLPWEQTRFMEEVWPTIHDIEALPFDDPKVAAFPFKSFYRELRRAAFMSDANWEYPLGPPPFGLRPNDILLPDVQGMRNFAGRGLTIWINQQIAKGDIDAAIDGVRTQLACSRHIAQTPVAVTQLVALAIQEKSLERLEVIVQQPDCPNLFWSLATLPDSLCDFDEAMQVEMEFLPMSLPSLGSELPDIGDARWDTIGEEFIEFMAMETPERFSDSEAAAMVDRVDQFATKDLKNRDHFDQSDLAKMSPTERVLRWVLIVNEEFGLRTECAFHLPPELAIERLDAIDAEIESIKQATRVPATPFLLVNKSIYAAKYRFDRHVKLLQVIEALRDHLATGDGTLPDSLDELRLPVPVDPWTNKPFDYVLDGQTATLRWENRPFGNPPERRYVIKAAPSTP